MSLATALGRPPRCVLINVASGESMECLLNPTELSEKLQVNWTRLTVPGLSHQVLQFQSTGNRQIAMEFYLDRFFAAAQPADMRILSFRAFLRALTVPPAGTEGTVATAPPRVIVVWPKVITLEAVVASVDFQYRHFGADLDVLVYTASVAFEEILDVRVTSESLRGAYG